MTSTLLQTNSCNDPLPHAHWMVADLFQSHLNVDSDPLLSEFGSFPNHHWILQHKMKEQLPLFLNKKQTTAMFILYNNSSHVRCFVNRESCSYTVSCNYGQCLFSVMVMIQYSRGTYCFLSKAQTLPPHQSCYKYKHSSCSFNS